MASPYRKSSVKPPPLLLNPRRASVILPRVTHATQEQQKAIAELEQQFALDEQMCRNLMQSFQQEMRKGLQKDDQSLKMLPTYVTGYPTGEEKGTYLALEISGMDVYVCQVKLKGERGTLSINQYQYRIPDELAIGEDVSVLLDYLTDCVADFLSRVASQDLFVYSMGLSFGFPVQQLGLNKGKMLEWGHGFDYSNVLGQDIVELFHQSFRKKGLAVKIVALANDSVCTLLAHAYQHPSTRVGVLHGAGTNCAYYETRSNISKLASPLAHRDHSHDTIVNTEWGGFDDDLRKRLPLTSYDRRIDRESNNTHVQVFEKMVSGMYLGEIVRNIIMQFIDSNLLFSAESSPELNTPYAFNTSYMYVFEADATDDLEDVQTVLIKVLNIQNSTQGDREVLKKICELVGSRSARLLATMLAAISSHTIKNGSSANQETCTIAVSGDMYEDYPSYHLRVCDTLNLLLGEEIASKLNIGMVTHSRLVGCAIVAMMAEKAEKAQLLDNPAVIDPLKEEVCKAEPFSLL